MSLAYQSTHSYTATVVDFHHAQFHSDFVNKADELEVYSALYRLGLIHPDTVPQFVKDARPLPKTRPDITRLTYFEYIYFDFATRSFVIITVKIEYE